MSFKIHENTTNIILNTVYGKGVLSLPSLKTDPETFKSGDLYYNADTGAVRLSIGVDTWINISDSSIGLALLSIQGLTTTGDEMIYTTGTNTYATSSLSSLGRLLVASNSANSAQSVINTVVGVDVQSFSNGLEAFASLSSSANNNELIYTTGSNTFGISSISAFARNLIDDTTGPAMRTTLGFSTTYVPSGDLVGTTDNQVLSGKTLMDNTNIIRATSLGDINGLFTITITTGGTPPVVGDLLEANGGGTASWKTPNYVEGTSSSTNNQIVRYDGESGRKIKNSSLVTLDNFNSISGVNTLTAITLDGTLSTPSQTGITQVGTLTSLTVTNNITIGGTVDGVNVGELQPLENNAEELGNLSTSEIQQLQNIGSTTINSTQWSYLGGDNQSVNTSSSPSFTAGTFSGKLNMNGGGNIPTSKVLTITDIPTSFTDATNKGYVDSVAGSGLKPIEASILGTTTILPNTPTYSVINEEYTSTDISTILSIDGTDSDVGNRILVKNQLDLTKNGVYIVNNSGVNIGSYWKIKRTTDFNSASVPIQINTYIFVNSGSILGSSWVLDNIVNVIDTDNVEFNEFSSSPSVIAGAGLDKTDNTINIVALVGSGITVNANDIKVSDSYSGGTSITTVGTIGTGTWEGNTLAINKGGTNATNVINARNNLGLIIGTDVQPQSTPLSSIAGLTTVANKILYTTAVDTYETSSISIFGRSLIDDVTALEARTTLGFGDLPSGELVGTTDIQSLKNKSFDDTTTLFTNTTDPTKIIKLSSASVTSGQTRTLTVPDSDITIVGVNIEQVLINKTLTDPTNTIRSTQLGTTSTDVVISSSDAPVEGQLLIATSGTAASWQTYNPNVYENSYTIAVSGGDYTSIVTAISDILSKGTPTIQNQVQLIIYPGTYTENNPIIIPEYITLNALKTSRTVSFPVRIIPTTPSTIVIQLQENSNCFGVMVEGASSNGGIGFYAGVNTICQVAGCATQNCQIGFLGDGCKEFQITDCSAQITTSLITGSIGFKVQSGGLIEGTTLFSLGQNSNIYIEKGFLCTGSASILNIQVAQTRYCDIGIQSTNGSVGSKSIIRMTSGEINYSITSGINVGSNAIVEAYSVAVTPVTSFPLTYYDLNLTDSTSEFIGGVNKIRNDLTKIVTNSSSNSVSLSLTPDHIALDINTGLHVGSVIKQHETSLGSGDSHPNGMTVLTYNGVSTYNDITSSVRVDYITSVPIFQSTAVGNILYIGQTKFSEKFTGLKLDITTSIAPSGGFNGNTNHLVSEYWNGTVWVSNTIFSTNNGAPYLPYANKIFNQGKFFYRFGDFINWTQNTVNSISGYWLRFRIVTQLTTIPTVKLLLLNQNSMLVNGDGFVEYFGKSQSIVKLPFDLNWMIGTTSKPGSSDIYLDDTNSMGRVGNSFNGSGGPKRIGFLKELAENTDTSKPLVLRVRYQVSSSSSGNIETVVRWGYNTDTLDSSVLNKVYTSPGDAPTTAEGRLGSISSLINVSASSENKLYTKVYKLDISRLVARRLSGSTLGDLLWVSIERTNSVVDTYTGTLNLIQLSPIYTKWCEGGYREDT